MQVFSRCFTIKLSATPPPQVSNLEESQTRDTSPGDDDPGRLQSAGNLDSPNWWSGRHRCPPGFTGLFEGADHSPGSTAETSPPLPSGGLHFPSLHLLVTPERQTSDWPRPSLNAASSRKPVQMGYSGLFQATLEIHPGCFSWCRFQIHHCFRLHAGHVWLELLALRSRPELRSRVRDLTN
ncbi:uncharacterized protein [Canis lupus baileyi]|uniref:uncharacterized protein isoform X8 n=1 Tax=Canis lupus baileyi TaxID=143281 RepID=UPI003B976CFC